MKRIRIWLNGFNLVQQFLGIVFVTIAFFILLASGTFSSIIDDYVNNQMYSYLENASEEYVKDAHYVDPNVKYFIYETNKKVFDENINSEDLKSVSNIDFSKDEEKGTYVYSGKTISYSIKTYGINKKLVSIANDDFRDSYKENIINVIIRASLVFVVALFAFFLMWIFSLIVPLNQIKTYIEKKKNGEKVELKLSRHDEIGEVANALVSMNNELEKQNAIKEEMIQNISHDLKTPIATIKSYSESIKDGIYPYGTLEKSVDVILEHADRLEKKVYSLITLNKVGYLTDVTSDKTVNMNEVIKKAILSLEVLRNDISINTNLDENIEFHGEEEPWRVVVENLLDNALRYAKTHIDISLSKDLLEVYNDGELMEKDRIDKLFKPYEKGTKGKFGLGLSIVKRVSETYGYSVVGENKSDGVVFRIYANTKAKKSKKVKIKNEKEN